MRVGWSFILIVLGATLAGCLAGSPQDELTPVGDLGRALHLPESFTFDCPPGSPMERAKGVCSSSLVHAVESLQEPFIALDPNRPNVIALGLNAGQAAGAPNPARPSPGADVIRMLLAVSVDGGATWRFEPFPYVADAHAVGPADLGATIDPTLAFDEDGVLHVSGMATQGGFNGWRIFYSSTPDLGRSWSPPVLLTEDRRNDRSWITTAPGHRVFITWGNPGESSALAWSQDGGRTWQQRVLLDQGPPCTEVSPVLALRNEYLVACTEFGSDGRASRVRILAFDPDRNAIANVSEARTDGNEWPMLVSGGPETVHLVSESGQAVHVLRSLDAGRTWGAPISLRALVRLDDAWTALEYQWVAADPWGALHVLLKGGSVCTSDAAGLIDCEDAQIFHLALDPKSGRLIGETQLTPTDPAASKRLPPTLGPTFGAEYDALAFGANHGYLFWGQDGGVDYSWVTPAFAAATIGK